MARCSRGRFGPPDDDVPNANDPAPRAAGAPSARRPRAPATRTASTLDGEPARRRRRRRDRPVGVVGLAGGVVDAELGRASVPALTDTAWACLDLNASACSSTMPPYLVGAAPIAGRGLAARTRTRTCTRRWEEFAKQLFWDYQLGEAFVLATARYATGWPGPVPCRAAVDGQRRDATAGRRRYTIGARRRHRRHAPHPLPVVGRRRARPRPARGRRGPAGRRRGAAPATRTQFAASGGVPPSVLEHPEELTAEQAAALQAQWVAARACRRIGEPAVLSGGVTWKPTQVNPKDMALRRAVAAQRSRGSRCCSGCRRSSSACPSGGDSMTYANVTADLRLPLARRAAPEGADRHVGAVAGGCCRAAPGSS